VGIDDEDDGLGIGAASITIDRNLSALLELHLRDVPDVLDTLPLSDEDRQRVLELAERLDEEMRGERSQARLGVIIAEFRSISREAYERIGKPMYVTLVGSRPPGD
jgi:hypothetical protein